MASSNPLRAPAHIAALLERLHKQSEEQEAAIDPKQYDHIKQLYQTDPAAGSLALDSLMRDKFIALEADKAEFLHQLIVATKSSCIVEAGTSYGVSTIYLALAVAEVEKLTGKTGKVVATEKEPEKAQQARAHWRECGEEVAGQIELREGDLTETLKEGVDEVDLLLLDIWPPVALPALKAVLPKLKPGALVLTDNTIQSGPRYRELFSVLRDPEGDFRSSTLPFKGGFEISVYLPQGK